RADGVYVRAHIIDGVRFEQFGRGVSATRIDRRVGSRRQHSPRPLKADQPHVQRCIDEDAVGLKAVKDPAVAMELFGELTELNAAGARHLLVHLIHVGDGLAVNLLEDDVRNLALYGMLEWLEEAEALKSGAGLFEIA